MSSPSSALRTVVVLVMSRLRQEAPSTQVVYQYPRLSPMLHCIIVNLLEICMPYTMHVFKDDVAVDDNLVETPHFRVMIDLSGFRVQSATDQVFYIPEFVSIDEEQYLLRKVVIDILACHVRALPVTLIQRRSLRRAT